MILWNITTIILLILSVREIVKTVPTLYAVIQRPSWTGFTFLWFVVSFALYLIK